LRIRVQSKSNPNPPPHPARKHALVHGKGVARAVAAGRASRKPRNPNGVGPEGAAGLAARLRLWVQNKATAVYECCALVC
jgi:hypothetical protein